MPVLRDGASRLLRMRQLCVPKHARLLGGVPAKARIEPGHDMVFKAHAFGDRASTPAHQHILGFVDLGSKIIGAALVGMCLQDQPPMRGPDFLIRCAFLKA